LLLFFSNRYTPTLAAAFMAQLGGRDIARWVNATGEEAVLTAVIRTNHHARYATPETSPRIKDAISP